MVKGIDTLLLGWSRMPPARGSISLACKVPYLVYAFDVRGRSNEYAAMSVWGERPEALACVRPAPRLGPSPSAWTMEVYSLQLHRVQGLGSEGRAFDVGRGHAFSDCRHLPPWCLGAQQGLDFPRH